MLFQRLTIFFLGFWLCVAAAQPSNTALSRLNQYRADLGLSQLTQNVLLDQTALGHSQYLTALPDRSILSKVASDGTPEMHLQRAGNPKFTGATIGDRTRRQGYRFGAGEQVVFNERYNSGPAVVDQLMTTVYHRTGLLNPSWSELGSAVDTPDAVLVLGDGPVRSKVAADWMAYYPAHQGFARQVAFQNELPDPAPEYPGKWLGLPVSIHGAPGMQIQVQSFTVQKMPADTQQAAQAVVGKILDNARDRLVGTNEAFFLPINPLDYSAKYDVKAQVLVNKVPRTLEWTFQTPPNPFMVLPIAKLTEVVPGVPQTLELQGTQGNWGWNVGINSPMGTTIEAKNLGNGRLQVNFPSNCDAVCRLVVTVKHEGPHPSTEVREFVTSKAWLASKPPEPVSYPKELLAVADSMRLQSGSKALAYAVSSGRWVWSTGSSSGSQEDLNRNVLANCVKQAEQMGSRKCELYPFSR